MNEKSAVVEESRRAVYGRSVWNLWNIVRCNCIQIKKKKKIIRTQLFFILHSNVELWSHAHYRILIAGRRDIFTNQCVLRHRLGIVCNVSLLVDSYGFRVRQKDLRRRTDVAE